jgi:hypothetical protein
MENDFETELTINSVSTELNPFVEEFLTRTVVGAVSSLKGTEDIRNLELYVERGEVKIVVNGNELPLTAFPKEIITNTITGLVSTLKGVDKVETLCVKVRAV